ncbi:MAG: pyruvate kinase [Myxococcota bacterium]
MTAHRRAVQIVCTIGPASREPAVLEGLIDAGMSVARLNFAHGTEDEHRENIARIRAAGTSRGRTVAILQDLAGPKLRLGPIRGGRVTVLTGSEVTLTTESIEGTADCLPIPDEHLTKELRAGGPILIGDGAVELEVLEIEPTEIRCRVIVGGEVASGKGVNVPGGLAARPILDEKDRRDLELGVELGIDFVGVSYVRSAEDLITVRKILRSAGRAIPLVAKIETSLALERLDEILAHSDAVMVARGDLSLEFPFERVPMEQKRIVRVAMLAGRPVITATQMLHSMVTASRPTRAEVNDVANAVLDGTDAVMLSDETAVGIRPAHACHTMARIVEETLNASPPFPEPPLEGIDPGLRELVVFARAAVRTARDVGARAILTWARGGVAARLLSRHRPTVPILAPTRFEETSRRLALPYGVRSLYCPTGTLPRARLEEEIGPVDGSTLMLVVGHNAGEERRIPWMRLVHVSDADAWAVDPRA